MTTAFRTKLNKLYNKLLKMAGIVEDTIQLSVEGLRTLDAEIAKKVIEDDDIVDDLEYELEVECLSLLATQQPLAKDLRLVGATLKVITDLERIADHAVDISKITLSLQGQKLIKPLIDIPRMAEYAVKMLHEAVTALINEDLELARKVIDDDDFLDNINKQIFHELLILMIGDPKIISQSMQLLMVSMYLERIGDHATNVAEWVYYIVEGKKPKI
ncbi:MAG: phosphate signaling complex protein PhoU [Clostridia bacterium]